MQYQSTPHRSERVGACGGPVPPALSALQRRSRSGRAEYRVAWDTVPSVGRCRMGDACRLGYRALSYTTIARFRRVAWPLASWSAANSCSASTTSGSASASRSSCDTVRSARCRGTVGPVPWDGRPGAVGRSARCRGTVGPVPWDGRPGAMTLGRPHHREHRLGRSVPRRRHWAGSAAWQRRCVPAGG
jgi:hypothetical protein